MAQRTLDQLKVHHSWIRDDLPLDSYCTLHWNDLEEPFSADVRTSYGEFNTSKNRGSLSFTRDRLGCLLSLTHDKSNGFMEHTGYEQDAVYAKINYELGERSRLNFVGSYDEGTGEDPVIDFPGFWDDMYRRRTYQRLLFETAPSENLMLSFEGRHHRFCGYCGI